MRIYQVLSALLHRTDAQLRDEDHIGGPHITRLMQITFVLFALLFVSFLGAEYYSTHEYEELIQTAQKYIVSELAANELKAASDTLTQNVQLFVVTHNSRYLREFFIERSQRQRREAAVQTISEQLPDTTAQSNLQAALDLSNALLEREIYAMRLILYARHMDLDEAMQDPDTGKSLDPSLYTELSEAQIQDVDLLFTDEQLQTRALLLVHDEDYQEIDDEIDAYIDACISELQTTRLAIQARSVSNLNILTREKIVLTFLFILLLVFCGMKIHRNIIAPLNDDVVYIQQYRALPMTGAYELRYLARAYNQALRESRQHSSALKHQAEHDPLTGLLNRGAFDKLLAAYAGLDFALIILDVDLFKAINDTYGHKIGDKVLKKVAHTLQHRFRSSDFPCRIGGDEFAVIFTDIAELAADHKARDLIRDKLQLVTQDLVTQTSRTIPAVTLSIGVAMSVSSSYLSTTDLFNQADQALYQVKQNGRNAIAFFDKLPRNPGTSKTILHPVLPAPDKIN